MSAQSSRMDWVRVPSSPHPGTTPELRRLVSLWLARICGERMTCDHCRGPLALSVVPQRYQWSCVGCGWVSRWFRVNEGELWVSAGSVVRLSDARLRVVR